MTEKKKKGLIIGGAAGGGCIALALIIVLIVALSSFFEFRLKTKDEATVEEVKAFWMSKNPLPDKFSIKFKYEYEAINYDREILLEDNKLTVEAEGVISRTYTEKGPYGDYSNNIKAETITKDWGYYEGVDNKKTLRSKIKLNENFIIVDDDNFYDVEYKFYHPIGNHTDNSMIKGKISNKYKSGIKWFSFDPRERFNAYTFDKMPLYKDYKDMCDIYTYPGSEEYHWLAMPRLTGMYIDGDSLTCLCKGEDTIYERYVFIFKGKNLDKVLYEHYMPNGRGEMNANMFKITNEICDYREIKKPDDADLYVGEAPSYTGDILDIM